MRFSIRDLMFLTIIAGLGIGWWLDRVKLREDIASLERKYFELEGSNNAALENERRIANLRAMEAWGRLDIRANTLPSQLEPSDDFGPLR